MEREPAVSSGCWRRCEPRKPKAGTTTPPSRALGVAGRAVSVEITGAWAEPIRAHQAAHGSRRHTGGGARVREAGRMFPSLRAHACARTHGLLEPHSEPIGVTRRAMGPGRVYGGGRCGEPRRFYSWSVADRRAAAEPATCATKVAPRPHEPHALRTPCPLADPRTTPLVGEQHRIGLGSDADAPDCSPPSPSDQENSRPGRKRPSRCKFLTSIARQLSHVRRFLCA